MSFFQNLNLETLQKNLQSGLETATKEAQKLSSEFTPIATRTARQLQEKLGATDDISQLPQEYVELEKKIDALKAVYTSLLNVTSTYESEGYDYPSRLNESLNEFSKSVTSKVEKLAAARSTGEAQSILVAPVAPAGPPKTLNHAIATAANLSALKLQQAATDDSLDLVAQGLTQLGHTEAKLGDARLQQDALVRNNVNDVFRRSLKKDLVRADQARKIVENKRLSYDAARSSLKHAKPEKEASLRVTLETLEDEFAAATEDAVSILKNVLDNTSILNELVELVTAQLAYHKASEELLSQLLPNLQSLRDDSAAKSDSNDI